MVIETSAEKVALRAYPSFTCAGVNWGIEQLKVLLGEHGTVYIPNKNGLVHNNRVTEELRTQGAVFVEDIKEVPEGAVVANSMHGLSPLDLRSSIAKSLLHYDLSCPLVDNVHQRVLRAITEARKKDKTAKVLYYCKDVTHPEPKAVIEQAPSHVVPVTDRSVLEDYQVHHNEMYFADSQTTLNVQQGMAMIEEYRDKFTGLRGLPRVGICFATYGRQGVLDGLIQNGIKMLVVLGSPTSSNTTELVKIGKSHGLPVEFLERGELLEEEMVRGFDKVGLHGGASVLPDEGDKAMDKLKSWGYKPMDYVFGQPEPLTFPNSKPKVYDFRSGQIPEELLALTRTY